MTPSLTNVSFQSCWTRRRWTTTSRRMGLRLRLSSSSRCCWRRLWWATTRPRPTCRLRQSSKRTKRKYKQWVQIVHIISLRSCLKFISYLFDFHTFWTPTIPKFYIQWILSTTKIDDGNLLLAGGRVPEHLRPHSSHSGGSGDLKKQLFLQLINELYIVKRQST